MMIFSIRVNIETTNLKESLSPGDYTFVDIVTGPQRKSPSNCLPKTQVSANTKVDV